MKRLIPFTVLVSTLSFITVARGDTALVFNEIMYHPAVNEPALEWVEFHNQLAVDLDVSEWSITGGIDYKFPVGTVVKGGGYVVVAISPSALQLATGLTGVLGPFTGRLSNNGERLVLRNNSDREVDAVEYGVDGNWPVGPDGSGVSLAKRDRDLASAPAENWRMSDQSGGTPGVENFPRVPPQATVLTVNDPWKYEASGTDLGTSWRQLNFDDAAWSSRNATTNRSVPDLFNTGVGNNGVALGAGTPDPHYIFTLSVQGTNVLAIQNHSAWLANDATSSWIGPTNPGTLNINQGAYYFQTAFSLDGFLPSTVSISARVGVDNQLTNVMINGAPTGIYHAGFDAFGGPFTIPSGFVSGRNTLEFRTLNDGTSPNPGAFRAALTSSGLQVNTNNPLPAGRTTYYFRKTFVFGDDPANSSLRMNAVVADGAVFYLNGVEVHRMNLPDGPLSYSTPALSNISAPGYSGVIDLQHEYMVNGTNVLAVEVHQAAGSPDAPLLALNLSVQSYPPPEIGFHFHEQFSSNGVFWVEVANFDDNLDLTGFTIVRDGATDDEYAFPADTVMPSQSYLAVTNTTLGFTPVPGDKLYLFGPFKTKLYDAIVVSDRHRGRVDFGGRWLYPNQPTPGAANSFAFHNEIVINEIMYHHQLLRTPGQPPKESPEAWLELYNRSTSPVDLTGWELDGGIQYTFSPGKTIPAGGYLIVADDTAFLRGLYPSLDIVGDFGGRLSGKTERIVLRDPSGNPADEVRYYDHGKWPEYADGGGSSLELRSPDADNTKAGAWAASDESGKSSWQTYTYRMVANIPSGSGQPTTWNDFILGLQGPGECLIDDLTVVESPTGTPVQIIDNGNFESGQAGWRMLGTHNRSTVIVDPQNAANHVLRLVASSYQEHMHNHIERNCRTVTPGREYEVSFRAKWIAGSPLLNTRLYFNRVARTTTLTTPPLNGTPGAQNSRFEPNIGPTFSQLQHDPVVPGAGEQVWVTVRVDDPQGVSSCLLFSSANGGTWSSTTMAGANGQYTASIPGYLSGTVVQFYVRAVDGLGAAATYPARGPDSGALYKVNDGQANLSPGHNVRIILTPANIDLLHGTAQGVNQTNVMSNDLLPCTVVYDEQRAYYDVGVHLRGSQRGRYSDVRTGFHLGFQPDDLFRGVHPVMLIDRSGAGDATANRQEEIVLKHILNRAGGLPGTYSEISRILAPRAAHNGPAQFFPRHEDVFVETAFPNGGDGTQFEMELIYYPTTTNTFGYKNPQPDNVVGTDMTNLGDDKEIYRYNFMIKNHRDLDDYSAFIALCKSWSLTGAALDSQTRQIMDIDEWMRAYALVSLCSVGDMYTFGNNHNFFIYQRPSDGKFLYFPWDMDFAFSGGTTRGLVGDQNLGKLVNLPGNLRRMYAHMLDIINVSFNPEYMAYWTDHYDNFAPGQNYSTSLNAITGRVPFVRSTVAAAGGSNFNVSGPTSITTGNSLLAFTGVAPVGVQTILINGREYPITWTSVSAWRILVPINEATTNLQFIGYDLRGNAHSNTPPPIAINYTGQTPDPAGAIVINEIMYNPVTPNTAFVELYNRSSFSFDLSGWRINGIDYTFPDGSIMTNGQYLYLCSSAIDFNIAFGATVSVPFDQFSGNLQNDGETLTLLRPGTNPGEEIIVDQVRYEGVPAWPTTPNGTGPSLQLIDASKDNSRVGNWSDGGGWKYFSFTATNGTSAGSRLSLFLTNTGGDVFIDDISFVEGIVAGVGTNLIANAGFEAATLAPWVKTGLALPSTIDNTVAYSGTQSLHLIYDVGAPQLTHFYQDMTNVIASGVRTSTPYTLSFWYLSGTNSTLFQTRLNTTYRTTTDVRPIGFSPGAPNAAASTIPPFPDLWLNEAQAQNLTGIVDNQGEREPWVEIYNSGTNTISLAGYYLANSYSNLAQWPFPPGASIGPNQFKVIYADGEPGETTASEWHATFRLNASAGSVALGWTPSGRVQVLDYLNYTNLPANWSYGPYRDGQPFHRENFFHATPGGTNDNTAPPLQVVINEWMASNTRTLLNTNNNNRFDDWFELYNPSDFPANLSGFFLTDNLLNDRQFPIPPGYIIPPHGFLLVWADSQPSLNNTNDRALHVNFRLERAGEAIGLFGSDGSLVDGVVFEPQFSDYSQGRYPDGPSSIYFLASATPTTPNTSWANRYPVLVAIADAVAVNGAEFAFTASASDPDGNSLAFSLDEPFPFGAAIHPTSGAFSWTPTNAPSTNAITVRVTDNGTPSLSAARTFTVRVINGIRIGGVTRPSPGELAIGFNAVIGKQYRIDHKNALTDSEWTLGVPFTADSASETATIIIGAGPHRFYRLVQVD